MLIACAALAFAAQPAPSAPAIEAIVPEGSEWVLERFRFSPAVRAGDMIYLSGVVAGRPEGEAPGQDAYEAQFERAFQALARTLDAAGADCSDVAERTTYHVDFADETHRAAFMAVKDRYMPAPPYPAWTAIGVERLWPDNGLVEIRLVVYAPRDSE